ncbi:MAG: response regulator [Gemmatimonadota bacterium]|nr:response regulator [Gemmatimonadota bacterium]MDH3426835.1 response regulator [Gemmatimonadota bacterium]
MSSREGVAGGANGQTDGTAVRNPNARFLIVDDEQTNLRLLDKILTRSGYWNVLCTDDPAGVEDLFDSFEPDLVLLDLHMPERDGFSILQALREKTRGETFLPILVLTGDISESAQTRALAAGATDFVLKPFRPLELLLRIENMLETRQLHEDVRQHSELLELRILERTRELETAQLEIVQRLALAAEYRDDMTGAHAARVGDLAAMIGMGLGLDNRTVTLLRLAACLHDLGKIGIPDSILLSNDRLDETEWEVMRSHTTAGATILSGTGNPLLVMAREICASHHERWDGLGYPLGLVGEDIPLSGRIVSVADTFDTITSIRTYKSARTAEAALEEIIRGRGSQFDPAVVDAFLALEALPASFKSKRPKDERGRRYAHRDRRRTLEPGG